MRLLLLFTFILTIESFAQDALISIKGRLIDVTTKEPIPYASVYIKGKSIGTTTNGEGKFLFHVPSGFGKDTLVISVIGYTPFMSAVSGMTDKESLVELKQSSTLLSEVTVRASEKELTARDVVKKAAASITRNYPQKPFAIEGFFRDLQVENGRPVELLEAALRFRYEDYNPGYEDVEIVEVRRSFNKRHPINGTYDRQNSIIDLMEDNYVKHRFGPMDIKGWKFRIDSIFTYDQQSVYKISGSTSPSESTVMYINHDDYSILKLELKKQMVDGEYYRRYLNLPDPYGLQETSFGMVFEFQKLGGKMYLKYQREEDSYNLFNKTTNEIILRQSFVKELFVNNVIHEDLGEISGQRMNMHKSVEGQAQNYNAEFWTHYNAPIETAKDSKIIAELQESDLKTNK